MAVAPHVAVANDPFTVTIGSTDVKAGDMLYFDGTNWELADATDNAKFAEAMAVSAYSSGDIGAVCRSGILVDGDAPFTQGDTHYLSPTAGEITTTRPASSVTGELTQVVGYSLSTSEVAIDISIPREVTIWVDLIHASASGALSIDADWAGWTTPAVSDGVHGSGQFPSNVVGLKAAFAWIYNEDVLASGSFDLQVSSAFNDEVASTTNDGTGNIAITVTAADDIARESVSTAFDGTGLVDAGAAFGLLIIKSVETAADDFKFMGIEIVLMVV